MFSGSAPVALVQQKMVWRLEIAHVRLSNGVLASLRICPLLQSLLHQFPHSVCLVSVGVATEVSAGAGETFADLAWCAVGMGLGDS